MIDVGQRPFSLPDSDHQTTVALVPKGTQVTVKAPIRTRPRARSIVAPPGTYKVGYVLLTTTPTMDGGIETASYHLLVTGWPTPVDGNHTALVAPNGDGLYYDEPHPEDGKPWGWYGLDWLHDESAEDGDDDGYVRLRRMIRPIRNPF